MPCLASFFSLSRSLYLPLLRPTGRAAKYRPPIFFALIDQADQMVVYGEGLRREFVIYRSSKRKDFDALKSAITLKRNGGPFVCACVDGPEIAPLKNNEEIAAIWNHEGTAIGSSVRKGDWENRDPNRWLHWFDVRGMKDAREFHNELQAQSAKANVDEKRWLKAVGEVLGKKRLGLLIGS